MICHVIGLEARLSNYAEYSKINLVVTDWLIINMNQRCYIMIDKSRNYDITTKIHLNFVFAIKKTIMVKSILFVTSILMLVSFLQILLYYDYKKKDIKI